ncbi:MAG TPA: mismatch-specific DNA-glycosylase [Gammaproteobacteria bacterium]|nr:mismatch-specific DNA-glycosylase [Gammaproteobacteria bacterium]
MRLLSIGLNPSLPSVEAGFYFANPRNRFWKALNGSRLLHKAVAPGVDAMPQLLQREGIGFTDVVKRPTRSGAGLRAADFRAGAPRLRELIEHYRPRCAWFHGKVAYGAFLRHAGLASAEAVWGLQPLTVGESVIFVTPNPSPANAAYSLQDLVDWYDRLAQLPAVRARRFPGGAR